VRIAAHLVLLATAAVSSVAIADPAALFPVRIGHVRGFERVNSPSDAQGTLKRPLLTGEDDAIEMVKKGQASKAVRTCAQYMAAKMDGYDPADQTAYGIDQAGIFSARCSMLMKIVNARASRDGELHDYRFSRQSLDDLPPCLAQACAAVPRSKPAQDAALAGGSWRQFSPEAKVTQASDGHLEISDNDQNISLDLVAWGDFYHDGHEEILVGIETHALEGECRAYGDLLLTRRPGDHVERIVDAGTEDCPVTRDVHFPACDAAGLKDRRQRFKALYAAGAFKDAAAVAEALTRDCLDVLPSEQQHWALSDLALATFRAGDRRTCLSALRRSAAAPEPPVAEKLKAALEHNRAACSDPGGTGPAKEAPWHPPQDRPAP
jgi:hypothetical protein